MGPMAMGRYSAQSGRLLFTRHSSWRGGKMGHLPLWTKIPLFPKSVLAGDEHRDSSNGFGQCGRRGGDGRGRGGRGGANFHLLRRDAPPGVGEQVASGSDGGEGGE